MGLGSGFFLLDIVDDLGHVVFILAELGGILDQLLVLLLGVFEDDAGFLLLVDRLDLLGLEIGVGVLDLSLADPGGGDTDAMMSKIELFGKTVLPRIREI